MMFLYLAYTDLHVKIGRTKNPKQRKSELICGCPQSLEIIFALESHTINEETLHRKFREHRIHHEWFNLHDDIKLFIKQLRKGKGYDLIEIPKREDLYLPKNTEKNETFQEPVRIIKTSRVVDMLDTGESIKLKE